MDDIVIFGGSADEHDERVNAVFKRLTDNVVTADGIEADLAKVRAIKEMSQPTDVGHIPRFLGIANQRGKFSSTLSTVTQ